MIYIAADHRGYNLKEKIKTWLTEWGYQFQDMGAFEYNKDDDYPDFAEKVADRISNGQPEDRGILICGSGAGMDIVADKFKNVRATIGINSRQIMAARNDDDINVLTLAADFTPEDKSREMIKIFLETQFIASDKHVRRLNEIKNLEK